MRSTTTNPHEPSTVVIDTSKEFVKWRYTCPNDHRQFEPTNGGIWCRPCDHDDETENAHHNVIKDQRSGDLISMDRVRLVNGKDDE